jgi:hypothetical protein
VITPNRAATAWIGPNFIVGGESTNYTKEAGAQFHPATIHWKTPTGDVGWMRLHEGPRLNAQIEKDTLTISGVGDYTFRFASDGLDAKMLRREEWTLPGLTVKLETDAEGMELKQGDGFVDAHYREATTFTLHIASW